MVDHKNIVYGECAGWDCDECEEQFEVINNTTIQDINITGNTMWYFRQQTIPSDNKRNKTKNIDRMGQISVTEKVE